MIIDLAARNSWNVYQLDVKSAFLYGELKEAVFVEQPKGYEKKKSRIQGIQIEEGIIWP